MNSLSFIILLISITQNIGWMLTTLLAFTCIGTLGSLVLMLGGGIISKFNVHTEEGETWLAGPHVMVVKAFKYFFAVWLVVGLLSVIVPEQKYMIMIAASEVGERVIKSEAAEKFGKDITGLSGEATELLREYIKSETLKIRQQIEDANKPKSTETKTKT